MIIMLAAEAAVLGLLFWLYLRKRDQKISRIIEEIDRVLHDEDHLYISESEEGELAVLQSEIVKMTRRIQEQNDALKREKAYLADSLAGIAHQLRTPLTSVNLVLSFLETAEEPRERLELLREADSLLRRMDTLLTALLKLSRLDAGVIEWKMEPLELRSLVANALSPLEIPMEVLGITLQNALPEKVSVTADRVWLTEAVQNILKNCMESAGQQGRIEIGCEDNLLYTLLTIHDSGKGFRNEDLPHVFERFYRGKNANANGFGIGLALSKTIVDRHGGLITADNHPAGGALFTIKFYK